MSQHELAVHATKMSILGAVLLALAAAHAESVSGTAATGLYYETSGDGAAIVFIHAFSVDLRMWDRQAAAFSDDFKVIRYDLRGHGKSEASAQPYSGYEDLRDLLDELGIDAATLVGLSAGSELAINFALAYPDRVNGLVLAAPGLGGYAVPPLPWTAPVFEAAARGDAEGAAKLWAETPIMALRSNRAASATVTSLVMQNDRLWTLRRTERPLSPPAVGRLAEIRCPVLVLVGDQDLAHIRDIADVLDRDIPRSRRLDVPGAGHIVNLDTPELFNQAVAAFLMETRALGLTRRSTASRRRPHHGLE
jgi:3-oxoadipate enol-lactonase